MHSISFQHKLHKSCINLNYMQIISVPKNYTIAEEPSAIFTVYQSKTNYIISLNTSAKCPVYQSNTKYIISVKTLAKYTVYKSNINYTKAE